MTAIYRLVFIFMIAAIVSSCASIPSEQVDSRVKGWLGVNIDELIKYWGLPSNQRQVADQKYAEWLNRSSEPGNAAVSIGTGTRSRHSGIGIGLTLFDLGGSDDVCSRLVRYNQAGMVTEISWQGTKKYCLEITPDREKIRQNKAKIEKGAN